MAKCPIGVTKACSKWMKMEELPTHILQHTVKERLDRRDEAFEAGYDSMAAQLACPICHLIMEDHEDFAQHIHMIHLNDQSGRDHILACLATINNGTAADHEEVDQFKWVGTWNVALSELRANGPRGLNESICASCGVQLFAGGCYTNHHLEIHKDDILEVLRHRQHILKHYPGFINHSIFNDIRVTTSTENAQLTL